MKDVENLRRKQINFMNKIFSFFVFILVGAVSHAGDTPSLKDVFKNHFSIGVAVNQWQASGEDAKGAALIAQQFNSAVPENVLKWELVHPRSGTNGYDFKRSDEFVAFGEKHQMLLVGHTLAWHSQTPGWVFRDEQGRELSGTNAADRELLLNRLHDHISTVVGRYKGRIKIWDVVNEALQDGGSFLETNLLRARSPWVRILGEEFIVKAFEWAHEADPDAILRYNDYSLENPTKRKRLIALIKNLQAKKVPVMAIGTQTHVNLTSPTPEQEDATLTEIATLGLPIHVTELDVNAAGGGQRNLSADVSENASASAGGVEDAAMEKQAKQYGNLFRIFLKHRAEVKLVTLWGLTDKDSWRRNGRPLLFNDKGEPKAAFSAVMKQATGFTE